jgi:hypothetical protein
MPAVAQKYARQTVIFHTLRLAGATPVRASRQDIGNQAGRGSPIGTI